MGNERVCVYIPAEEYRELVMVKTIAECLLAAIQTMNLNFGEPDLLCRMFGGDGE